MFFADILIEILIRVLVNTLNRLRSLQWPVATATVTGANCDHGFTAVLIAVVHYRFQRDGEEVEGVYRKPSLFKDFAEDVVRLHPAGGEIPVRVKQTDSKVPCGVSSLTFDGNLPK